MWQRSFVYSIISKTVVAAALHKSSNRTQPQHLLQRRFWKIHITIKSNSYIKYLFYPKSRCMKIGIQPNSRNDVGLVFMSNSTTVESTPVEQKQLMYLNDATYDRDNVFNTGLFCTKTSRSREIAKLATKGKKTKMTKINKLKRRK